MKFHEVNENLHINLKDVAAVFRKSTWWAKVDGGMHELTEAEAHTLIEALSQPPNIYRVDFSLMINLDHFVALLENDTGYELITTHENFEIGVEQGDALLDYLTQPTPTKGVSSYTSEED